MISPVVSKVSSVEWLEPDDYVYDLTVAKNSNFFATEPGSNKSVLVHNCSGDVTYIFQIAKRQIYRAKRTFINLDMDSAAECYYPYFKRHMKHLMTKTVVSISHMETDGSPVDIEYLKLLMSKDSPLLKKMSELEAQFLEFPNVKATETRLMAETGRAATSLFGGGYGSNAFKMNKKDHLDELFYGVMELEPVSFSKKKKERAVDKFFVAAYKADHPEVKAYGEYRSASQLVGTYVRGWYKKLMSSMDSARDHILRPSFGFFTIVTGRLNSFNPSLQQVPSRGPLAPIIHRMFVAPFGHLNIRWDYNAAEVRQASVLSGDPGIAKSFKVGQKLRRMLIREIVTPDMKAFLKEKGWKLPLSDDQVKLVEAEIKSLEKGG